jgi:hypothetical protein
MLRSVLVNYLTNVQEREFDLPFLALLPCLGFYDVHFTHGQVEFGKDFIAKRKDDGVITQYSFQLKAGDIKQAEWRNSIMGQMLESVITTLSHPSFDEDSPHKSVLVITGHLSGNSALGLQDLNRKIEKVKSQPIGLWNQETLIEFLGKYGIEGIYTNTASDFVNYGNFYVLYGKSLKKDISEQEIEKHSRQWIDISVDYRKRILGAVTEAEIIGQQCRIKGLYYESIHANLTVLRLILSEIRFSEGTAKTQYLLESYKQSLERLHVISREFIDDIKKQWLSAEKDFVRLLHGSSKIITYLIHCARIIEISGLLFFLEREAEKKQEVIEFLKEFIKCEPGCGHIPSDYYAISLVLPILALISNQSFEDASQLICNVTIWLCDRYEKGAGLANFEAHPYDEITILIGYPFDFIDQQPRKESFLATLLSDISAFLNDRELYSNVVNDIKASKIFPQYWQVQDTEGLFIIEGEDIISYPNIEYQDYLDNFYAYGFAEHMRFEVKEFKISHIVGIFSLFLIMLLLRDRYFPTAWNDLVNNFP